MNDKFSELKPNEKPLEPLNDGFSEPSPYPTVEQLEPGETPDILLETSLHERKELEDNGIFTHEIGPEDDSTEEPLGDCLKDTRFADVVKMVSNTENLLTIGEAFNAFKDRPYARRFPMKAAEIIRRSYSPTELPKGMDPEFILVILTEHAPITGWPKEEIDKVLDRLFE